MLPWNCSKKNCSSATNVNPKRSHQQQPQNCEAVFSQDHIDHSSNRQSHGDSGQIGLQLQKSPWLYQRDVLVHLQLAKAPLTTTLPPLKGSQSRGAIGNEVSQEVDTERSGCNDVPITIYIYVLPAGVGQL